MGAQKQVLEAVSRKVCVYSPIVVLIYTQTAKVVLVSFSGVITTSESQNVNEFQLQIDITISCHYTEHSKVL